MKRTYVAVIAVMGLVTAGALAAWQGDRGPGPGGGQWSQGRHGGPRMQRQGEPGPMGGPPSLTANVERLTDLGVSEEQIEALRKIEHEAELSEIAIRAKVDTAEAELRYRMQSDADKDSVMEAVETLNKARAEMFKAHVTQQLAVRDLLGVDVLKQLRGGHRQQESRGGDMRDGEHRGSEGPRGPQSR